MILYLSMFYRRHELIFRIGMFYCAAPLSGAFGGLLATGLAEIKYHGYNRWPWIFIVEGIITVVYGLVAIWFLPATPSHATFLSQAEREAAVHRMGLDAHGANKESRVETEQFSWHWVCRPYLCIDTVTEAIRFAWLCSMLLPYCSVSIFLLSSHRKRMRKISKMFGRRLTDMHRIYSFSLFLPTIISSLGYSSVKAQLFTVPPNMAGFFAVLLCTYASDKIKARGPIMIGCCSLAIIGYILLLVKTRPLVHYGG